MIELHVLGGVRLTRPDGSEVHAVLAQPKRLALLAYLALERPGTFHRRDTLLALFWGDFTAERARAALRRALHFLRRELGEGVLTGRGDEEVGLDPTLFTCDAVECDRLLDAGVLGDALALYRGELLDGFFLADAPEFEQWLATARGRLHARARDAAWRLATRADGVDTPDRDDAVDAWRRLAALEPLGARGARGLMRALERMGDRTGAVAHGQAYVARLHAELGVEPDADVRTHLATLRQTPPAIPDVAPAPAASTPRPPPAVPPAAASGTRPAAAPAADSSVASRRRGRRSVVSALAVGLAVALVVALAASLGARPRAAGVRAAPRRPATAGARPRVQVSPLENRTGDGTLALLGHIAADWIGRGLTETRAVDVLDAGAASASEPAADMVVVGAYFLRGDSIGFEARVVDARSGRVVRDVEPALGARADPLAAVAVLRQRVAGALAAELDPRIAALAREASQPPTYAAYLAFVQGLDALTHAEFNGALPFLLRAAALDSTFVSPRIWAAAVYGNMGELARVDSIVRSLDAVAARLAPLDRGLLDVSRAIVRGDRAAEYAAAQRTLAEAPASQLAQYLAGNTALAVGRYDEAARVLRRIPAGGAGVAWDVFGTGTATALHLAGRYDEELVEARSRAARQPALLRAMEDEARALVAVGRLGAADSVMIAAATIMSQPGRTAGRVMLATALELEVHGHPREAAALGRRAAAWVRAQPETVRRQAGTRHLLGRALYAAGEWAAADTVFRGLLDGKPRDVSYLAWAGVTAAHRGARADAMRISDALTRTGEQYVLGEQTLARACIAAILGRRDDAVRLLRQAIGEGVELDVLHTLPDLLSLRGDPTFDALVRPSR